MSGRRELHLLRRLAFTAALLAAALPALAAMGEKPEFGPNVAVGDKESAKKVLQRAIDLASDDPLIESGSKASFVSDETKKLRQIN
jgi:hypothetical protein